MPLNKETIPNRRMFICRGIPKHWRLSLVQVRNVYSLLEFSLRHEERETQFLLCWLFQLTQKTRDASRSPTGLASPRLKNQLASPRFKAQLASSSVRSQAKCFFSKSPKFPAHRFSVWRHPHPSTIYYLGFLLWHLWLSHPLRVSMNTCT